MNRSTAVAIADTMCAVRPDWNQAGCISQLYVLAQTWTGTDAELAAHALAVAADPKSITPAAINATSPQQRTAPSAGQSKEPSCYICGRDRSGCQTMHDFEVAHGLPDPHIFETHEEADANTGKQPHRSVADLVLASVPRVNDYQESPERLAAKQRAREAVQDARRKVAWTPKAEKPDDQPRKCLGCGGTLSRDEQNTHPACEVPA